MGILLPCLLDYRCFRGTEPAQNENSYTRHTSSCMCVGYVQSPESLTCVSSSGFLLLPPSCNPNYLGCI
ncbi:hypothetical protein D5081_09765 [Pectobacterium carotovorum]|nr:hypothetical protein D5083_13940 [Pectobacterium carotovorum]RJL39932.1 hypothetical protein D5081_09765 [Pectobacterium carotovorum]